LPSKNAKAISIAYSNKAYALIGLEKLEDALECANKAIEADPSNVMGYSNKSSVLMRLSRYKEALECCDEAIKLNIADYAVYNNKGLALESQGKLGKALEAFNKSLELNPDYKNAQDNIQRVSTKLTIRRVLLIFGIFAFVTAITIATVIFIVLRKRKTTVQSINPPMPEPFLNYDELNQK